MRRRLGGLMALLLLLVLAGSARAAGEIQVPRGPLQQPKPLQVPRGPWQRPGEIQTPKGIQAVTVQRGAAAACERRIAVLADALFDFDEADLRPEAVETLEVVGPMLREGGVHPATVEGHTDAKGGDAYNQRLSERRAASVRDWLVDKGYVTAAAIHGFGESRPVAPNTKPDGSDDPEGRQKNRRVEIQVDRCR